MRRCTAAESGVRTHATPPQGLSGRVWEEEMREFGSLIAESADATSQQPSRFVPSQSSFSWIDADGGAGLEFHRETNVHFLSIHVSTTQS